MSPFLVVLLFQNTGANLNQHLNFSTFSPIYEVFMGIGFGLYVLTKFSEFLKEVFEINSKSGSTITESIESNLKLVKKVQKDLNKSGQAEKARELSREEVKLKNIKDKIESGRYRIVLNSRFYFLVLGFASFLFLCFCGIEEICLHNFRESYLSVIIFSQIYITLCYIGLSLFIFQRDEDEPVFTKIILGLAGLVIFILLGISINISMNESMINLSVLYSLFITFLPFFLLLHRHDRFGRFIKRNGYDRESEEINGIIINYKKNK